MTETLPGLPRTRPPGRPFDAPAELAELRAQRPLARMTFPNGHEGWLVTSHDLVRAVLADGRFSSRQELMRSPLPGETAMVEFPPASPGMFIAMDAPDHTRYRRLLAGKFTVRRMRLLTERVERAAADCLDAMERQGPPVDLVEAYAQPIPAMLICELLGVPYEDRGFFQDRAQVMNDSAATLEERATAENEFGGLLHQLVQAKRAAPTDDVLSDLMTEDLTDEELLNMGALLLGAGLDTTANMIGLGTFALLADPDQLAAWRDDPALTDGAVEEMLRYLAVVHTNVRTALEDVELGGQVIRAGESVALSMLAANRDPARYPDPDRLDLRRDTAAHVALGHGVHQCLGQQLARVEMRVAFPALLRRFPSLRLAVPADEIEMRDTDIYGVRRLPVAWDA